MLCSTSILLAFSAFSTGVLAQSEATPPSELSQYCFYSLYGSLTSLNWQQNASSAPETSSPGCTNTIAVTSIYASSMTYCSPRQLEAGSEYWRGLCQQMHSPLIDISAIAGNLTGSSISGLPRVDPQSNSTMAIKQPAILSRQSYEISYQSWKLFYDTKQRNRRFSWGMLSYWGAIVLLGIINNLLNTISATRMLAGRGDAEKAVSSIATGRRAQGPLAITAFWVNKNILIPATLGTYCQRKLYWCTVPQRAVALCITGYWVLCIILEFVGYSTIPVNILAPNVHQYLWQSAANRAGYIAYSTLPWAWMFAQRNNIFIWATGWSYSTFNAFHRHCARLVAIFAMIHGICYTVVYSHFEHRYSEMLHVHFFKFGIVALVLMWVLLASSAAFIRAKFYESFLLLHISIAIVIIYSLFAHSSVFHGSFNGYLWPLVAIWSFDRLLRLARIIYCNIHFRFSGSIIYTPSTKVAYDRDSDVIRVDIQPNHSLPRPAPGQYYHIYQPFHLKGWENHPFSLGAYTTTTSTTASPPDTSDSNNKELGVIETSRRSSCSTANNTPANLTLTFWIRPYDGWTRRMRDACLAARAPISPTLLLEGPYDHAARLHAFDTVVLLVGGTGISAALPYLVDHAARASSSSSSCSATANATRTTKIKLVWAVKQVAFVREMCRRELGGVLGMGGLEVEFYVTGEGGEDGEDGAVMRHGRPDIRYVVGEAAMAAEDSAGARSVVFVCGPAAMADEARAAVHAEMKRGCRRIEYVEDCFGW